MSLEEEIVTQTMKEGNDMQYLSDKVEALKNLNCKIDNKKIEKAIEKNQLIQEFDNQGKSKKSIKENLKYKVEKILRKELEEKKTMTNVLSAKAGVRNAKFGGTIFDNRIGCGYCLKGHLKEVYVLENYLRKIEKGRIIKRRGEETIFYFCKNCGTIFNKTRIGLYEEKFTNQEEQYKESLRIEEKHKKR